MTRARTTKEIEKVVNDLGYELLENYVKDNRTRVIIQDKTGYKYDVYLYSLIAGHIPDFVGKSNIKFALENIDLWLYLNRPEFNLYEENDYIGSHEKLKFFHNIPDCQEEFDMCWTNIFGGQGCSVCHGLQVGKYNNLKYLFPEISKEWHPANKINPNEVSYGSKISVYWICSKCQYGKGMEWKATINSRTNCGNGCPSCSGFVVSDKNRLSILFPIISSEWHPTKNGGLTPYDVSFGSARKVWWICKNKHVYYSTICGRTSDNKGCKQCSDQLVESVIATELKQWCKQTFKYVDLEHKMFKNPDTGGWLWCDIYLGKKESVDGIYIEVHGPQHYKFSSRYHITQEGFKDSQYRDKIKKKYARKNGKYIEIDLRKIKTVEQAIEYLQDVLKTPQ